MAFVGVSTQTTNGTTTIVLAKPAGVDAAITALVSGEAVVLLATGAQRDNRTWSAPPSGWAVITAPTANGVREQTWRKVLTTTEAATTYTFTASGSNDHAGIITAWDEVTGTVDVSSVATGDNANVAAASVTTTVANAVLIYVGASIGAGAFTPPAGMTERADVASSECSVTQASEVLGAAGATGSRTATTANDIWQAQLIVFEPFLPPAPDRPPCLVSQRSGSF